MSKPRGWRVFWTWATDWAMEHWPTLSLLLGGAVSTYLAAINRVIAPYGPLAWWAIGVASVFILSLVYVFVAWGSKTRTKAKYDARLLESGSIINPLATVFEKKRIILDQFVLPSFPVIDGKTFIDCDFIGPGNIYLHSGNTMPSPLRPPKIPGVWLAPEAPVGSMFSFRNCIFQNCSFQRIVLFASLEYYEAWKDTPVMEWIGVAPKPDDIAARRRVLEGGQAAPPITPAAIPAAIEAVPLRD